MKAHWVRKDRPTLHVWHLHSRFALEVKFALDTAHHFGHHHVYVPADVSAHELCEGVERGQVPQHELLRARPLHFHHHFPAHAAAARCTPPASQATEEPVLQTLPLPLRTRCSGRALREARAVHLHRQANFKLAFTTKSSRGNQWNMIKWKNVVTIALKLASVLLVKRI